MDLKRGLAFGLVLVLGSGCRAVGGTGEEFRGEGEPAPEVAPEEVARRQISARSVREHIEFLASDDRRGRGSDEAGLERSAAWIADELYRAGVRAAGEDGGFLQYWEGESVAGEDSAAVERGANVVGRLEGSSLARAGEYVVLVAHYDHLGVGTPDETGDSIYNGADDNASGVAVLVEVARAFAALPRAPARPVLFLAVSGGERGQLGSARFIRDPTEPLSAAVAVLNLDMVGRNHPDSIGVVGFGHSTLGPLIASVASATPELGLSVDPDPRGAGGPFKGSDHVPFARQGIPAVRFFSGPHEDHRTPSDEAGRVDMEKVARVARLVFLTAHRLASGGVTPEWTEAGRAVVR